MSEFNKEVSEITKSDAPINPNVYDLQNTMCFKTWNDIIISLPQRTVKWCCKTQYTEEQTKQLTFDLDTLSLDFLINHPILKQRKYELSGGTRCADCHGCWVSEDVSGNSVRTEYNKNFEELWLHRLNVAGNHPRKAIQFHQQVQEHDGFRFIEIELTNKCNMACVYCWEGASSRWQKELKRPMPDTDDLIFDKTIDILNEYWDKELHKQEYIEFSILGGEPFFTDHMYKFIEDFIVPISKKATEEQQIVLTVTTNLNFPKKKFDRFIELVRNTPNIEYMMQLSGEAVGEKSELIRWGLNWNSWDTNLDLFLEESKSLDNLIVGFGCAHNSLSYPYFKEFLVYLKDKLESHNYQKEIYMHTNWVDNPDHLAVRMIDKSYVDTAKEITRYFDEEFTHPVYKKERYTNILRTLETHVASDITQDDIDWSTKQFKILEMRRNVSFCDVFPHISKQINKQIR